MSPHSERSWPDLKYPSKRLEGIPSVEAWLEGKQIDDGAENLWRIHSKLYNLNSFINKHPGGAMWLNLTKVRIFYLFYCGYAILKKSG